MKLQTPWLAEAWRELGQREAQGPRDNPRIMALYRDARVSGVAHDETAWCAAFVGACLERAGQRGTASLMARSYAGWGKAASDVQPGSVAVFKRGDDPALGHVGFVVGEIDDALIVLGGNQADAVTVAALSRANLLALRWPLDAGEFETTEQFEQKRPGDTEDGIALTGHTGRDGTADRGIFEIALRHVLSMEGGYGDDPEDLGGPTNLGLTLVDLAEWKRVPLDPTTRPMLLDALRALDVDTARPIYQQRYWRKSCADALPPALALMHFDCAVNQGCQRASRFLQEAVDAEVDGEIGPLTLSAVRGAEPGASLARYAELRRAHYRSLPTFERFGRGWLARVEATLSRARMLIEISSQSADAAIPNLPTQKGDRPMASAKTPVSAKDVSIETVSRDAGPAGDGKWWGQSMTVWGALITAAATVAPALGPLIGLDISGETVRQIGGQAAETVRAIAGLAGTVMTIYGRARASGPLVRRDVSVRL